MGTGLNYTNKNMCMHRISNTLYQIRCKIFYAQYPAQNISGLHSFWHLSINILIRISYKSSEKEYEFTFIAFFLHSKLYAWIHKGGFYHASSRQFSPLFYGVSCANLFVLNHLSKFWHRTTTKNYFWMEKKNILAFSDKIISAFYWVFFSSHKLW